MDTGLKPPTYPPPCGGKARTTEFTQYDVGATIKVDWKETIDHTGCYQIALSTTGNDTDFKVLTQVNDPGTGGGTVDTPFTTNITLPAGVKCEKCTLQLRQLMVGSACAPDADPTNPSYNTYYSCADIRIGDFPDAAPSIDAGTSDEDPTGEDPPGSTTEPTDGGGNTSSSSGNGGTGSRSLRQSDDGSCNIGFGATGGFGFLVSAGLGVMAILRRRRKA